MQIGRMRAHGAAAEAQVALHGARVGFTPHTCEQAEIWIAGSRVSRIGKKLSRASAESWPAIGIDLSGFLILPGFINAHDHLEFGLFPRLADPPYRNYVDWGDDIHRKFPDVIARYKAVSKPVRMWFGGIRNLLCGVTTVCHHNPLRPELQRTDFPVRVMQEYGWAHSVALGGDLVRAHADTPRGRPFLLHACEGVDIDMRQEIQAIDSLALLDSSTILIHGLAMDREGVALLQKRGSSLILCPSSNKFLYGELPDYERFAMIPNLTLGNDSPLTAEGDLLDEIRFAIRFCGIPSDDAYRMVTTAPAAILRLKDSEGSICEGGAADLIALRDTGAAPADRLHELSFRDIEFVMIAGRVCLASEDVLGRLPDSARVGLEPILVDEIVRWVRAPMRDLMTGTEDVLGKGNVRLGDRELCIPAGVEALHVG
ncbi:MAG TPA: amidohydrolase family protein [Terracidiphilus sp.]|jgi:cytosine/adenosine deaminase-related metal-dependent hydrolase|nr:amidohydrolase family protein [Terracidiphilus sp.]